jgi:hypothetical protein
MHIIELQMAFFFEEKLRGVKRLAFIHRWQCQIVAEVVGEGF